VVEWVFASFDGAVVVRYGYARAGKKRRRLVRFTFSFKSLLRITSPPDPDLQIFHTPRCPIRRHPAGDSAQFTRGDGTRG